MLNGWLSAVGQFDLFLTIMADTAGETGGAKSLTKRGPIAAWRLNQRRQAQQFGEAQVN